MKYVLVKLKDIMAEDRQTVLPGSPKTANLPYLGLEQIEAHTGRIITYNSSVAEGKSNTFFLVNQMCYMESLGHISTK